MISKYIRLVRPASWSAFLPTFAIGFALGITPSSDVFTVIYGFVAIAFGMSFCLTLNTLGDIDVDRFQNKDTKDINLARQPIVTGEITEKKAIYLSVVFLFFCLFFAWFVSLQFFLLRLLINAWGIIYSLPPMRFKARPIGDILSNTMASGLVFIAGLSMGGDNMFLLLILVRFISPPIYYIPTPVWDYKFDKKVGLKTSAVYFGPKRLMQARYPFVILSLILHAYIILIYDFEIQVISLVSITSIIIATVFPIMKMKNKNVWSNINWITVPLTLEAAVYIIYGLLKLYGIFSL
jgi:geranylgeranylglycerol-phosphate geranylgeranyltransferase